jgi:hypothetical protein
VVISASHAPWQELLEKRRLEILKIKFEPVPYELLPNALGAKR